MSNPFSVTELVERANKSLQHFLGMIDGVSPNILTRPKSIGEWSVKDIINHLAIWEEETARAFETWKIGIEPDWSHIEDLDKFNQESVNSRRRWPINKAIEQLKTIHNGLIENIKNLSDAEISRRGGLPHWLCTQITSHIDEHAERVAAFIGQVESRSESAV